MKIIGMYDHDQNNLYTYKTDLLEFGYQKVLNQKEDNSNYNLILSAKIRCKYLNFRGKNQIFENSEIQILLDRTLVRIR